jgi:hypothetical protein
MNFSYNPKYDDAGSRLWYEDVEEMVEMGIVIRIVTEFMPGGTCTRTCSDAV